MTRDILILDNISRVIDINAIDTTGEQGHDQQEQ
jgi:hypothetical protein